MLNKKGYIMAVTMVILVVFMLMGTFTVDFVVNETTQVSKLKHKAQAKYIARTGALVAEAAILDMGNITEEIDKLNLELSKGEIVSTGNKVGEHTYDVILKLEADGGLLISSSSTVRGQTETVEKVMGTGEAPTVESTSKPINLTYAVFTEGQLTFLNGTPHKLLTGKVGTNSKVAGAVKTTSDYNFDITTVLTTGSDSSKVITMDSYNKGRGTVKVEYIKPLTFELPLFPEKPQGLPKKPDIKLQWDKKIVTINESTEYNYIEVPYRANDMRVVIDTTAGDVHVVVKKLKAGGYIHIIGDNQAHVYVEELDFGNGAFNTNRSIADRKLLNVYYSGNAKLNFANGSSDFNGSVYVEKADFTLGTSTKLTGNVVSGGKRVDLNGAGILQEGVTYAPLADVYITGSGIIRGALVGKTAHFSGSGTVNYVPENIAYMPIKSETTIDVINGAKAFTPGYFK